MCPCFQQATSRLMLAAIVMLTCHAGFGQVCGAPDAAYVCCGDVNHDGVFDTLDVNIVAADVGCVSGCCAGATNWDGKTDLTNLGIVLNEEQENGGAGCQGYQPVPLLLWNPDCYLPACDDQCQAALGCLPLILRSNNNPVSFGDLDADGWPDAASWLKHPPNDARRGVALNSATSSVTWTLQNVFSTVQLDNGYGVTLGDYNRDGFPEYANEQHGGSGFRIGVNQGGYQPLRTHCRTQRGCRAFSASRSTTACATLRQPARTSARK